MITLFLINFFRLPLYLSTNLSTAFRDKMLESYAQLASGDSVLSWQQKQYRQHAQTQISDSRQINAQMNTQKARKTPSTTTLLTGNYKNPFPLSLIDIG